MHQTVFVDLAERSYDVEIGPDLLAQAGARISPLLHRPRVAVLTDETVAALHLDALRAGLAAAGVEMTALALPPGPIDVGASPKDCSYRLLRRVRVVM